MGRRRHRHRRGLGRSNEMQAAKQKTLRSQKLDTRVGEDGVTGAGYTATLAPKLWWAGTASVRVGRTPYTCLQVSGGSHTRSKLPSAGDKQWRHLPYRCHYLGRGGVGPLESRRAAAHVSSPWRGRARPGDPGGPMGPKAPWRRLETPRDAWRAWRGRWRAMACGGQRYPRQRRLFRNFRSPTTVAEAWPCWSLVGES